MPLYRFDTVFGVGAQVAGNVLPVRIAGSQEYTDRSGEKQNPLGAGKGVWDERDRRDRNRYDSKGKLCIYKRPLPVHKLEFRIPAEARAIVGHTRFTT